MTVHISNGFADRQRKLLVVSIDCVHTELTLPVFSYFLLFFKVAKNLRGAGQELIPRLAVLAVASGEVQCPITGTTGLRLDVSNNEDAQ